MKQTVLVVDDSLTVRMDLVQALESAGFETIAVKDLASARASLATDAVDAAVLDVVLPDGDGVDLLRQIRASADRSGMPVLLLSNEAEVWDRIRGMKTGADEYVGKPYDSRFVVARLRQLLSAESSDDPSDARPVVLVIDDSPTLREHLRVSLEEGGYRVCTAASGEEGLQRAAAVKPAAIVVDGVLPGIDGPTVIRRLRLDAALRHVPCLLLTGSEQRGAELRALEAGADAFLRKSEPTEVVLARLAAALRQGAGSSGDAPSVLGPKRILAVTDVVGDGRLADALAGEVYDLVPARSAVEALDLLAVQSVDCVIVDVLSQGRDGSEICRRMKSAPVVRDVPVLALLPRATREETLEVLSSGADEAISWETDPAVLRARIRSQLRRRQISDEGRARRELALKREMDAAEADAARELAETRAALVEELRFKNRELEAFSYSLSHDLRAPLRAIDGFSRALVDHLGTDLDEVAVEHVRRIDGAVQRMRELIDDILRLSRVSGGAVERRSLDLTALARSVGEELAQANADRDVRLTVAEGLVVDGDPRLLRILLENLLGNAWKFTAGTEGARVDVGVEGADHAPVWFVRDNGVGFDMARATDLFVPFQRLHPASQFPGTGIGLATVQRIVGRHGGRVWGEARPNEGAVFRWTLPPSGSAATDPGVASPRGVHGT